MDLEIQQRNISRMNKLLSRLESAKKDIGPNMPLSEESFDPDAIDDGFLLRLDGFRVRFSDLQDLLGQVVFPMVCRFDEDETTAMPLSTRERQVLMEKKGLIELIEWKKLREIRNSFMHEYPDEHEEKAIILNRTWESTTGLAGIVNNISNYLLESK